MCPVRLLHFAVLGGDWAGLMKSTSTCLLGHPLTGDRKKSSRYIIKSCIVVGSNLVHYIYPVEPVASNTTPFTF